ncbi:glycosyltransferase family 2 protein [Pseudomonas asplenii]|uniref:glycosyltransferase family 2 protein n=1 Tax=Pseudomonas asplenii TaxID=53407 RepID=UPI00036BDEF1|nr:glycosyltransferase family 2 protein [Pseudomonas fuscovaginae]
MKISLVVPVYNEEQAIPLFYEAVRRELLAEPYEVEIVFVNDGSTDNTESVAQYLALRDNDTLLINFSRNFGKEPALFAGIEFASGDAVIPIDVDLQDPIEVIPRMVVEWLNGADVVLAKRRSRSTDSYLKRQSSTLFYRVMNRIAYPHIEENVGDFRLMDRKVIDVIKKLPEYQLFMKGVLSWAGFSTRVIEYDRAPRINGKSKFNGWKLWNLALDGITSFSTLPLRLWTYIGGLISLGSLLYALYMVFDKLLFGNAVPGYPSLMTAILFLSGVQLIGLGILGEYIGRIYIEAKHRPRYVIRETVGKNFPGRPSNTEWRAIREHNE